MGLLQHALQGRMVPSVRIWSDAANPGARKAGLVRPRSIRRSPICSQLSGFSCYDPTFEVVPMEHLAEFCSTSEEAVVSLPPAPEHVSWSRSVKVLIAHLVFLLPAPWQSSGLHGGKNTTGFALGAQPHPAQGMDSRVIS